MLPIDGRTRTFGLIGNPIEHTLSPFIHNILAEYLGINAVYLPFYVKNGSLCEAVHGARALNFVGNNVTIPYKVDVMEYVDFLDEDAKKIGAVNTLHYREEGIYGYNTDYDGLLNSCEQAGVHFENRIACIFGAGGAAKCVAMLCAQKKVRKLYLINRTIDRALALKKQLDDLFDLEIVIESLDRIGFLKDIDLCFQTTSVGMSPHVDGCLISENGFYDHLECAVDLIYNPKETVFLKKAAQAGANTLNGLGMLFYQAVKAFEIWFEVEVSEDVLAKVRNELEHFVYSNQK